MDRRGATTATRPSCVTSTRFADERGLDIKVPIFQGHVSVTREILETPTCTLTVYV